MAKRGRPKNKDDYDYFWDYEWRNATELEKIRTIIILIGMVGAIGYAGFVFVAYVYCWNSTDCVTEQELNQKMRERNNQRKYEILRREGYL